jgi:anti-sigma B factor antagonist
MQLTRREIDGVLVLSFAETVDLEGDASRSFRDRILRVIEEGRTNLVFDLGGAGFVDSSGIGVLVAALKSLRGRGGDLRLANVPPHLRNVLTVTRLDRVFDRFETVEEAVVKARDPAMVRGEIRP